MTNDTDSKSLSTLLARIEELAAALAVAEQSKKPPSTGFYFAKASKVLIQVHKAWGFDLDTAQDDLNRLMASIWLPQPQSDDGYVSSLRLVQEYTPAALAARAADSVLRKGDSETKLKRAKTIVRALEIAGLWGDIH